MEILKNQKKLIQAIIFISIMLFFGYLPPFGAITEMGMKVLGIFLGCILAWCCGEIVWPSILGLILMGFTGYQTVAGAFSFGFGHTVVWLVVFALIFLHAFTSSNLTDTITKYILSRKFVTKGPWYLAMAFWLVAGFVSLFITITPAVTLVIWTFFYGTCKKVGIKPYSRYYFRNNTEHGDYSQPIQLYRGHIK
mgnify:CR=1 FL=1